MFYCKPCQIRNVWPETMFRSRGTCEVCDQPQVECFEAPSSTLPVPPSSEASYRALMEGADPRLR